jgi:single-stranded-DNA-specific exonuclease
MLYNLITPNQIEKKLKARFAKEGFLSLADLPHPSTLKDMDKAINRITKAIENREKIVLIGDYDVDGIVSTTLIKLFFNEIGVNLRWMIPNRFMDGYGLSISIIEKITDYDLAITVDNGISALEASKKCKEYGIDLIITDHHIVPDKLPIAYAIINQKQKECRFPYKEICGAQIAWYLIASLNKKLNANINIKNYLGLVSIAIIADMMPLQHINRAMVKAGLKLLVRDTLPAVKAFVEKLNKHELNADDIAFQIAPILNSAGRIKDAKYAVNFLLSDNIYDAKIRLEQLIEFNENRKAIEQEITQEALNLVNPNDKVLVINGDNWHEGVIGIVASRVGRIHKKPTIILTKSENGDLKGSGRSFYICNLFEITSKSKSLLSKFGGHHSAIGLSLPIDNLNKFKKELQLTYLAQNYNENLVDLDILGALDFRYIDFNLINLLKQFEPYGQGNSRPKFITYNVVIEDVTNMGKKKEHKKFLFSQNGIIQQGVLFKNKQDFLIGKKVNIIYTLNENTFNGRTTIQLMIEEIRGK